MDLSKLNSGQTNSSVQAHHNYADLKALGDLKAKAREDQQSALRPVAEQFEALFVQQILKESRKVSFDDNWLDGNQGDFYKDWYDKQLALNLSAKGTLGFADTIVEQLSPTIPVTVESLKNKAEQQEQALESATEKNSPTLTEQVLSL